MILYSLRKLDLFILLIQYLFQSYESRIVLSMKIWKNSKASTCDIKIEAICSCKIYR